MPPINTGDRKELGKLLQSLSARDQVLDPAHFNNLVPKPYALERLEACLAPQTTNQRCGFTSPGAE